MSLEYSSTNHMNFVQITDFDWWHATFTVFWQNIAFIAVHSGERCGP